MGKGIAGDEMDAKADEMLLSSISQGPKGEAGGVVLEDRTKSECMERVEVRALEVGPECWD